MTERHPALHTVVWGVLFVAAVVVQIDALYRPEIGGDLPFAGADKVAHALLFAVPMLTGILAGIPARPLAVVLMVQAVVSEVVQGVFLPHRSGDPLDALTDVISVLVVLAAFRWAARRR